MEASLNTQARTRLHRVTVLVLCLLVRERGEHSTKPTVDERDRGPPPRARDLAGERGPWRRREEHQILGTQVGQGDRAVSHGGVAIREGHREWLAQHPADGDARLVGVAGPETEVDTTFAQRDRGLAFWSAQRRIEGVLGTEGQDGGEADRRRASVG